MTGFWRGDELYDLESDPGETANLIDVEPARAEDMRRRLALRVAPPRSAR